MYLGNSPNFQNFAVDRFNGGGATHTLTYAPGSAAALAVFVDGVYQVPTTDYTVSGLTLTPTTAFPSGTLNVVVLYLGREANIGTPSDGTVTTAKLDSTARVFVGGVAKNLAARTHASVPTAQITITADELVVKDTSGNAYLLSTVSVSPAITGSGANGLDTGAEAGNTWYYGWVIYNPSTQTVAGLLSTSATAPTMPSGYTAKALVTAVRNGASDFVAYRQYGNEAYFVAYQTILSAGTAETETAVTTSAAVPPIALAMKLILYATATVRNTAYIRVVTAVNFAFSIVETGEAGVGGAVTAEVNAPNTGALYYINVPGGGGSAPTFTILVLGFRLPVGGE
jgi:hypothetical protein